MVPPSSLPLGSHPHETELFQTPSGQDLTLIKEAGEKSPLFEDENNNIFQWSDSVEQNHAPMSPSSPAAGNVATPDCTPCVPSSQPNSHLNRKLGQQKRLATLKRKMEQRHVTEQEAKNQAQARQQAESSQQAQAAQAHRIAILSSVLETSLGVLNSNGLDLSDFLVYVFDPSSKLGNLRSAQFWRRPEQFWLLMRHWLARGATESGKELVKIFAIDLVTRIARSEAQKATRSGFLKSPLECVSPETAGELSLESLISQLEKECSTMFTILTGFCTSRSHQKAPTEVRSNHRRKIVAITAMSLLRQYNRMNNKFQTLSSLFLYASGVTRQGVSVISSYGNSISYTKLIARPPATRNPASGDASLVAKKLRRTGTLFNLSQACRELTQSIAKAHPVGIIYDNINLTFRVAEQRLGRADTFESGTCATVFKLFKASPEDMQVSDLITSFKNAPGLTLGDLQLLPEEASLHQRCLIHTLLDIIVTHGGSLFEKYQGLLSSQLPVSQYKRELHIDAIHPLPTMDIEEGTVKGNIEICANIFKELGFDTSNLEFQKMVWLLAGDQQTIARLRAIAKNRMGHEAGYESFEWLTQVIGLFHLKMAQTKGVLETHLGRTNSSRNPTCLAFQNTLIHRKPIPSPAPFYLARDLIRVSLYARVLDCLLLVSGAPDLSTLAQQLAESDLPQPSNPPHSRSFAQLEKYAQTIYAKYASRINVYKLRQERNAAAGKLAAGDMIYEDSCLFICDALDLESFISAVKAGDSGRVLILLKLWSCAFRASGHPKYAQEMLFLIHNIEHVWPPALRDIVFNNWLLNPTGKPNSHVELDLVQEHLIYWIKTVYKAHGSNASWEWLANISPCVAVLRKLAREFHQSLGVDQGVQHSPVELAQSISTLMRSFNTNAVHTIKVGRNREKSDGAPVVDTLSEGMRRLVHGTNDPIAEFNLSLKQLQQRCQLTPITYGASQSLMQPSDINMDNVGEPESAPIDAENGYRAADSAINGQLADDVIKLPFKNQEASISEHKSNESKPPSHEPQGAPKVGDETQSSQEKSQGEFLYETDSSTESDTMSTSDWFDEESTRFDIEFELGPEQDPSLFGLEEEEDDFALDYESEETDDMESDTDSLVGQS